MKTVVDKVQYVVHMRQLDDDGNTIGEISTDPQNPLTLYAHQLGDLPSQVEPIVAQAQAQAQPKPVAGPSQYHPIEPAPNRTQPLATTHKKPTLD
jgi:hypothetical protein